MTEMKHTPGPWVVLPGWKNDPDVDDADFIVGEVGEGGDVIATIPGPVREGTTAGNANLIAAAPDLLVALEGLIDQACTNGCQAEGFKAGEHTPACNKARAVLAKVQP